MAFQIIPKVQFITCAGRTVKMPKQTPNSRFSASVNLGSSSYYQTSLNQVNTPSFLNNTLSSSVSYSKTFQGEPQVNMSVTANPFSKH